jgi:hypothetical protein
MPNLDDDFNNATDLDAEFNSAVDLDTEFNETNTTEVPEKSFGEKYLPFTSNIAASAMANLPFGLSERLAGALAPEGVNSQDALAALQSTRKDIETEAPVASFLGKGAAYAPLALTPAGASIPAQMALGAGLAGTSNIAAQTAQRQMNPAQEFSVADTALETTLGGAGALAGPAIKGIGNTALDAALAVSGIPRDVFEAYVKNPQYYSKALPEQLVRTITNIIEGQKAEGAGALAPVNSELKSVAANILEKDKALLPLKEQELEAATALNKAYQNKQAISSQFDPQLAEAETRQARHIGTFDFYNQQAEQAAQQAAKETVPNPLVLRPEQTQDMSHKILDTFDNINSNIRALATIRDEAIAQLPEDPAKLEKIATKAALEIERQFPQAVTTEEINSIAYASSYPEFKAAFKAVQDRLVNQGYSLSGPIGQVPYRRAGSATYAILRDAEDQILRNHPQYDEITKSTSAMRDLYQLRDELQDKFKVPVISKNRTERNLIDIENKLKSQASTEFTPTERQMFESVPITQELVSDLDAYGRTRSQPTTILKHDPAHDKGMVTPGEISTIAAGANEARLAAEHAGLPAMEAIQREQQLLDMLRANKKAQQELSDKEIADLTGQKSNITESIARLRLAREADALKQRELRYQLSGSEVPGPLTTGSAARMVRRAIRPGSGIGDQVASERSKQAATDILTTGGFDPTDANALLERTRIADIMGSRLRQMAGSTGVNAAADIAGGMAQAAGGQSNIGRAVGAATNLASKFFNRGQVAKALNQTSNVGGLTTDLLTPAIRSEQVGRSDQIRSYLENKYPDRFRPDMAENEKEKAEAETAFLEQDAGTLPRNPEE